MKYALSIAALVAVAATGPVVTKRQATGVTDGMCLPNISYDNCHSLCPVSRLQASSRILNYALTLHLRGLCQRRVR
jgi:hypothetical protein